MATLTGNTIASTYTGLLSVTGAVGADTVEAVTDGAGTSTSLSLSQQRATITLGSGAADDFIVDGTTLVVEGDNNRVGIGTASPARTLDVVGDIQASSLIKSSVSSNSTNLATANGGTLILENSHNTDGNFSNIGGYNTNGLVASQINFVNVSQSSRHGAITLNTHNGTSLTERVRVDKDGKVGIGQTTVNAMLDIDDNGANTGIGVPQIRVGSINNTGVYGLIGFGWGGNTTYSPVTIGGLGTSGSGSVEADFVINTRDGTSDAVPVERMRVTHDGSVGIHTTSPNVGSANSERGVLTIGSTDNGSANNYANLELQGHAISNNVTVGDISFYDHTNQNAIVRGGRDSSTTTGFLSFFTNGGSGVAERMRIDSAGGVGIGAASFGPRLYSIVDDNEYAAYFTSDSDSGTSAALGVRADYGSGTRIMQVFFDESSNLGEITYNGSAITYGGTSDERLKKDISSYTGGLSIINQMEVKNFTWKKYNKKDVGLIAQELYDILPSRVVQGTGGDEVDRPWQVDYPRLVPYLIQAVQELSAKVEALENA